ncbi:hypothetical protein UlMin_020381 [Ulmus minor]
MLKQFVHQDQNTSLGCSRYSPSIYQQACIQTHLFTILIQALCKQEKMEEAMQVFVDMERNGCEADWRKIERGYEILDSMIQKGHTPDQMIYFHIMLKEEMKKIGCIPHLNIYNTIIWLACNLGEVKQGVLLCNELILNGLSPGLDTFVIMIHGFLKQEMVDRGLLSAPQYGTFKELMNKLLQADKLEMAKDVWSGVVIKVTSVMCLRGRYGFMHCFQMGNEGGLFILFGHDGCHENGCDRQMTFKMYKRRGERDLKEKDKEKKDGRKRTARRRSWGGKHSSAKAL